MEIESTESTTELAAESSANNVKLESTQSERSLIKVPNRLGPNKDP